MVVMPVGDDGAVFQTLCGVREEEKSVHMISVRQDPRKVLTLDALLFGNHLADFDENDGVDSYLFHAA